MPPKRKKVGRPKGRRTKKVLGKANGQYVANHVKVEGELASSSKLTKARKLNRGNSVDIIPKPVISCKECNKKFRFKTSYAEHLRNEHSKVSGSVACDKCQVRCPDKQTLKEHTASIHDREIFKCPHCEKQFVRHSHVLRHLAQKGCDGRGVSTYPCEICNAEFSRKDNLMVHLRLQHIMRKDYACKHCPYATRTFSKLIIHMQKHSAEPPQYECDHCGKSCSSRAAIAKHLEIHGNRKFACEVCGYSTFTVEVMRRHVLTHVKEKPYQCPQCALSFIQRVQLQRHMERHSGKVCAVCDRSFDTMPLLVAHMKEHRPHMLCPFNSCPFSKKMLTDKEALELHIQSHDDKRYACEVCNKRFASELNMRRHVLSHTLERPRRCMYCVSARAYVRGQQLVRHVRKAHAAVFREHLTHVRTVLGINPNVERVKKSELDAILNVLDAEAERILQGYGEGVLYGGMQEAEEVAEPDPLPPPAKDEKSALMMEAELAESLNKLLSQLIDKDTLECFGWPHETVDTVLEKVIEHCGARAADRDKWTRVQRLRENAKHLFLYVVEDKTVARMLHTHTIDQIVKHILAQVTDPDDADGN